MTVGCRNVLWCSLWKHKHWLEWARISSGVCGAHKTWPTFPLWNQWAQEDPLYLWATAALNLYTQDSLKIWDDIHAEHPHQLKSFRNTGAGYKIKHWIRQIVEHSHKNVSMQSPEETSSMTRRNNWTIWAQHSLVPTDKGSIKFNKHPRFM